MKIWLKIMTLEVTRNFLNQTSRSKFSEEKSMKIKNLIARATTLRFIIGEKV